MTLDRDWFRAMYEFLGGVPSNYLVCDCESNSAQPRAKTTLITQLGYYLHIDGEDGVQYSQLLDWSREDLGIDQEWLQDSLLATQEQMEKAGRTYHTTYERMCTDGVHPREALEHYHQVLAESYAVGLYFVGHNIWKFDRPAIERHFRLFELEFRFPLDRVIDTGMIEKASMVGLDPPEPGSRDINRWYEDVAMLKIHRPWNLDQHCGERYGINAEYNIDKSEAHDAGFDCWFNHIVLQKQAALIGMEVPA